VVDVAARPVSLINAAAEPPVDLSFADLRSVSPIHIEYLRNMGVSATMSLSLMVDGRLWGLLACHHDTPRRLSGEVRLVCESFAHMVSARIASLVGAEHHRQQSRAATVREAVSRLLIDHERSFSALDALKEDIAASLDADAMVVVQGADVVHTTGMPRAEARRLAERAVAARQPGFEFNGPPEIGEAPGILSRWPGVIGRCFDSRSGGWLILVRREERATIRWAGEPTKGTVLGPNGARLTPRGSFDVWEEQVRGRARDWTAATREPFDALVTVLLHHHAAQAAQVDTLRSQMLAVLGHDLRNPLQAIKTATAMLERGMSAQTLIGQISKSTNRMTRMIAQSLDFTRASNGLPLSGQPREVDMVSLLREIVGEFATAYPTLVIDMALPESLPHAVDADRIGQVLANLLSNARHHGRAGSPVALELRDDEQGGAIVVVRNESDPIPPGIVESLFEPFKRTSVGSRENPTGLGIGLFIVAQIAREHGGAVTYRHESPHVVFTVTLPRIPG
jgi:two-component system, chemotaxis family, sensor kinase Cph1